MIERHLDLQIDSQLFFHTLEAVAEAAPLIATKCNGDVLALLERCYWTTDRYDKEKILPLASLEAWWLAPAPA